MSYIFEELGYTEEHFNKFGALFVNYNSTNEKGITKKALFDTSEEQFVLNFNPNKNEIKAINEIRLELWGK